MFSLSAGNSYLYTGYYRYFYFPEPGTLDHFISEFSRVNKGLTVIQVGANDGFNADPIHKYIKRDNWKGIVIEPLPDVYREKLEPLYRRHEGITTVNAAISDEDGTRKIYRIAFSDSRWATGLTSFNRKSLEAAIESGYIARNARKDGITLPRSPEEMIREEDVDCISVPTLLKKYGIGAIDWLQIDTEGFDFEVIKLFDPASTRPRVIVYENSHMSREKKEECRSYLMSLGYLVRDFGRDTLAARDLTDRLDLFFTLEQQK